MATTNYIDNSLPTIGAAWLNDVDAAVYEGLLGATTPAAIVAALALSPTNTPTFAGVVLPALGLVDGRDVSVDGAKLDTIAAGAGVASNSFVNIAVATQGTVIATTPTDTLTLVAGANIGITTVPATDNITIAVTGTVPNATNAVNATNATNATTATSAGNSTTVGGLTPGNNSGNIPINNGVVNTNLNAQMLQGYQASETNIASRVAVRDSSGFLHAAAPAGTASDDILVNRAYYFANMVTAARGTVWTASAKVKNTTYTNSTGKTIVVNVSGKSTGVGSGNIILAQVNAVTISSMTPVASVVAYFSVSMEVPNGQTYRIDDAALDWLISTWAELL